MKDPVSGSLSSPINMRFRIKCGMTGRGSVNDPINKIDPARTQYNYAFIGTIRAIINNMESRLRNPHPPDPPPKPPECYSTCSPIWGNELPGKRCCPTGIPSPLMDCEQNEVYCKLEGDDLNNFYLLDANGNVIKPPNFNPAYYTGTYTALSGSLGNLTACSKEFPDDRIIKQENKDYDLMWTVDEKGKVHYTPVDKDGNPIPLSDLPESEQDLIKRLENATNKAIEAGINWLGGQNWLGGKGFKFNNRKNSVTEIMKFASRNLSKFLSIISNYTPSGYFEFFYNATIGLAIACEMKTLNDKYYRGDYDKGQYDQEIGFWTSFWSKRYGWTVGLNTVGKGINSILGLVDIAVMVKALMYKENGELDPNRTNKNS